MCYYNLYLKNIIINKRCNVRPTDIIDSLEKKVIARIKYARIYDLNDQLIGQVSGSDIIDHADKKVGHITCLKVYNVHNQIVGYVQSTNIFTADNKRIGSCKKSSLIGGGALLLLIHPHKRNI